MKKEMKILANNIKKYRDFSKITQEKLAETLNVEPRTISRWENGGSFPSMENLSKLAKAFNVKVADFFEGI